MNLLFLDMITLLSILLPSNHYLTPPKVAILSFLITCDYLSNACPQERQRMWGGGINKQEKATITSYTIHLLRFRSVLTAGTS